MKLSIDLGGTNIRIARVENGTCQAKKSVHCLAHEDADTVLGQLSQLITEMIDGQVTGIGIGVPSIVDAKEGIVYNVANIASWKEVHLKTILENKFHIPVAINNDSNCFTWGEHTFGEGKSYANMVGVTIGTGIGSGVVINNQLYGGLYTGAGEVGALPYLDSDYEHYCSSFFFKRHNGTGAEFAQRAAQGEPAALEVWREFGTHFGQLMKAILYTYAPQAIILGGGIAAAFDLFEPAMRDAMQDFPYQAILTNTRIFPSSLKDASLLGASALLP